MFQSPHCISKSLLPTDYNPGNLEEHSILRYNEKELKNLKPWFFGPISTLNAIYIKQRYDSPSCILFSCKTRLTASFQVRKTQTFLCMVLIEFAHSRSNNYEMSLG